MGLYKEYIQVKMKTVKLTFELDPEAIKTVADLVGCNLNDEHLKQLKEREFIIDKDSHFLKNQELVVGLSAIALSMLHQ